MNEQVEKILNEVNYKTICNNSIEENIVLFENAFSIIEKENKEELLSFIRKSDFYSAPASTKFHSSETGGLLKHSLLVMYCLIQKAKSPVWEIVFEKISLSSLILVSLCHDLCKTYFYNPTWKNVKVYSENGSKSDNGGRYDWETQQGFECIDKYPLGHGEKSCYFLMQFIKLSVEEYSAVRWHMGFSEPRELFGTIGQAMDKYPLILALHEADQEATHIFEVV